LHGAQFDLSTRPTEMPSIGPGTVLPEKLRQLLVELRAGHDEVSPARSAVLMLGTEGRSDERQCGNESQAQPQQ